MSPDLLPPRVLLPSCPHMSSLFLNTTHPSFRHITSSFVYSFYFAFRFTTILVFLLGLSSDEMTCFPVQRATGLTIEGGGILIS